MKPSRAAMINRCIIDSLIDSEIFRMHHDSLWNFNSRWCSALGFIHTQMWKCGSKRSAESDCAFGWVIQFHLAQNAFMMRDSCKKPTENSIVIRLNLLKFYQLLFQVFEFRKEQSRAVSKASAVQSQSQNLLKKESRCIGKISESVQNRFLDSQYIDLLSQP